MSPTEFRWFERRVYDTWLFGIENDTSGDSPLVRERLAEITREDLAALEEVASRHGNARGLRLFEERLQARLDSLEHQGPPPVDGVCEADAALLWSHRQRTIELRFDEHFEMHSRLRSEHSDVRVTMGEDD
jgi:hypothetical protein